LRAEIGHGHAFRILESNMIRIATEEKAAGPEFAAREDNNKRS
jgi:hypothetical protein